MDCIIPVILILKMISISRRDLQVVANLLGAKLEDAMKEEDKHSNEPDVITRIMEINKRLLNTPAWKDILGGDMKIPSQRSTLKCLPSMCLWPHSEDGNVYVPILIDHRFSESQKKIIIAAWTEFNALTCVKFKHRKYENSFVHITAQSGCWSIIGRIEGPQQLSLEIPGCLWPGIIQHELMHSIGFIHEHSRSDRDQYVTIHLENVEPGMESNFDKLDSNNLETGYDYGSLMHYGKYIFSKNSLPTMEPTPDPEVSIGQAHFFSESDIYRIRKLYKCKKCEELLVHDFGTFTSPNYPKPYLNYIDCKWIIQAPKRNKVLLEFDFFHVQKRLRCSGDYIEIYDGLNTDLQTLKGPECGKVAPAVISSDSTLSVVFSSFRNIAAKGFSAKYQFVKCAVVLPSSKPDHLLHYEYFGTTDPKELTQCVWLFDAPQYHMVVMTVKILNFRVSEKCVDGYLNIVVVSKAPPDDKGKYCGAMNVPKLKGRTILLKFKHPGQPIKPGFLITYKFILQRGEGCIHWSQQKALLMVLSLWLILS